MTTEQDRTAWGSYLHQHHDPPPAAGAVAAPVGAADDTTGQAVCAFVILREGAQQSDSTVEELRSHVAKEISPIAKPKSVMIVTELPKTRSGKIVRRLLGDLLEGRPPGDTTSLQDEGALDAVRLAVAARPTTDETAPTDETGRR